MRFVLDSNIHILSSSHEDFFGSLNHNLHQLSEARIKLAKQYFSHEKYSEDANIWILNTYENYNDNIKKLLGL